MEIKKATKDS